MVETDWSCIVATGTELLEKCDLRKLAAGEERRMKKIPRELQLSKAMTDLNAPKGVLIRSKGNLARYRFLNRTLDSRSEQQKKKVKVTLAKHA